MDCYFNKEDQIKNTVFKQNNNSVPIDLFKNQENKIMFPWQQQQPPLSPPPCHHKELPLLSSRPNYFSTNHSWHPLWTTTSSTWQNNDVPKRSRSISANTADDYFLFKKDNDYSSSSTTTTTTDKSSFKTPSTTGFMEKNSIWSFEERRHSIAVIQPPLVRPITPPQQVNQLIQQLQQQQQQIDEYFSPTTAVIDVQYLGKGISIQQLDKKSIVYQIQFKSNYQFDYFYIQPEDTLMRVQLNDMVIVEADRGYDLGRIIHILPQKSLPDHVHNLKRIFRHANSAELSTYELKRQDEEKALIICQAKIKQKNLNMEVVDAEYQWDRRKLTFYFKADERIDFRELVRELFKIYKTRIWMCAYSSTSPTSSTCTPIYS
ncbi:PSP1 C-terminal conserved region-domain-containing protein [Cokeromyces recurvatus]|uniref:PSP1 C-terminal conserved region-domain-containing protein n=1 Tax=Cokeromyces recurvatus TaxID=90255 RepID=UPI002220C93A|nr:PSP1 C-terminal conserved region-domain-containing protein [Cokeromyces recurvatus]KAI7907284.1 PSP1 C-terminal conserved region-domain-containing protein [Cokeromyces recurvatus]